MKPGIIYRGEFVNVETDADNVNDQKLCRIDILDTEYEIEDAADEEIIELEMADIPLRKSASNNGEDKFEVFRPKSYEIRVHTSTQININTFAEGGDNRYKVNIYYDSVLKFRGFLSISDLEQEDLVDPNELVLTAIDGLGFLEGEELTDYDGDRFQNENTLMDYLAGALQKKGYDGEIWCVFNIREQDASTLNADTTGAGHFFKHESIDCKTFEKDINEFEDCRTAIEKILGREAYITTHDGNIWIIRVDEYVVNTPFYVFKFDAEGNYLSKTTIDPVKSIGSAELISWMNDDQQKSTERPVKHVLLTFMFEFPLEIPCNVNFSRGDFVEDLPDETYEDVVYSVKKHTLDCWEKILMDDDDGTEVADTDFEAWIEKVYTPRGDIFEQYVYMTYGTDVFLSDQFHCIKSSKIPMGRGDKFTFSGSWKMKENLTGSNERDLVVAILVLEGDDGINYVWTYDIDPLSGIEFDWRNRATIGHQSSLFYSFIPDITDEQQPQSFSITPKPLPVSGNLYIYIPNYNQFVLVGQHDIIFTDLKFEYIPFIGGSYRFYSGQSNKVVQPTTPERYKSVIEEQVYISDAPRRLMKGCLLKVGGDDYVLTEGFYNAAVFPDGPPDETYVHPYYHLQVFDNWNQYNRVMRKFEGVLDKFDTADDFPDIMHKYELADPSLSTSGKIFMAMHMEQDIHNCETSIFLHEVDDENIERTYPDKEFKLIARNG